MEGDLDSYLGQPKHPLLQAVGARSQASGWGDVASGVLMIVWSGYLTAGAAVPALIGMFAGAAVLLASTVLIHCSAFWLGNNDDLNRAASEFLVLFSVYPKTVFTGGLRVVLFTILPAGFISFLPVDTLRAPGIGIVAMVVGGALLYGGLAVGVFATGLRRYESGNRFGVRA